MSDWSAYRVQRRERDEKSIRELVREEMRNARIVTRRINAERAGMAKRDDKPPAGSVQERKP